jgi:DNA-directed RNA polymerase specialized sigma subunit
MEISDENLIENIQADVNTEKSLSMLIDRHSGIYLDMVNSYSSPDNQFANYGELIKDKEYKIYSAALKFDKTKGAKFSTYLGNETKWMCLNSYNKNKRRPAFHAENIENMPENNDPHENSIESNIKRDLFNKVLSLISKHPDKRVEKIFNMRYIIGQRNKVMPWKDIGSKMNLSIQGCINIHNSVVNYIQDELNEEIEGGS